MYQITSLKPHYNGTNPEARIMKLACRFKISSLMSFNILYLQNPAINILYLIMPNIKLEAKKGAQHIHVIHLDNQNKNEIVSPHFIYK